MRAGLALIAVLALGAMPVMAQGKTKAPPEPGALQALDVCALFAADDPKAAEGAIEAGWAVTPGDPESPFVRSTNFSKHISGLGYADGFVLVESYPHTTFGYCRIDVMDVEGDAQVKLIDALPGWQGELTEDGVGTYGSWDATDGGQNNMLLSHEDEFGFVLQLTMMKPKPAAAPAPEAAPADDAGEAQ